MFTLPQLNYKFSELEPYIDEKTVEIHYSKHHQAYIDNLNKFIPDKTNSDLPSVLSNISSISEDIRQAVINHGGGHANHILYWENFTPRPQSKSPTGKLLDDINSRFGSFENFQTQFVNKSMSIFGSGWAFLQWNKSQGLTMKRHSFQNSPIMHSNTPLLGIDVWEHAYYLKYQNRRLEYLNSIWNIIDWEKISQDYQSLA